MRHDIEYEFAYSTAMEDEFEKIAGISSLTKNMSSAGIGRLMGAGVGAMGGAVAGGSADKENPGAGALKGALIGAGLGAGAGQLSTRMGRGQVKRIGQRQLHGLTGYVPTTAAQRAKGVSRFGRGLGKEERVKALKDIGMDVGSRKSTVRDALDQQVFSKRLPPKWREALAKAESAGVKARRHASEQGYTSIPGVLKGLATRPVDTLKTGLVSQGPAGMLLGVAPAAAMVPGAIRGEGYGSEYSNQGGMGRFVGENLGYTAFGAVPLAPMIAGAALAGKAGEFIHKGVSNRRDRRGERR